jgi:UDP-N-acetylmuramate: L-alanyl-gamma-D-glutamyl-meso-diaminopimelate ligase
MHGLHNLANALAVSAVALDEGISTDDLGRALASFSGIKRRQQVLGESDGVIVVDDFAHHPTAVRATIRACRSRWPDRRIVAVFEPRSNSSRRKAFETGYSESFSEASAAFLSRPPFRHNDDKADFMDIDAILAHLSSSGIEACAADSVADLLDRLMTFLQPGDVALIMSNGGFGGIHKSILRRLDERSLTHG